MTSREYISINEALLAELVERPGIDASNVIEHMRAAQKRIRTYYRRNTLDTRLPLDEVDAVVIGASANGHIDLFALATYQHEA